MQALEKSLGVCSENIGAISISFAYAEIRFHHDAAHFISMARHSGFTHSISSISVITRQRLVDYVISTYIGLSSDLILSFVV